LVWDSFQSHLGVEMGNDLDTHHDLPVW